MGNRYFEPFIKVQGLGGTEGNTEPAPFTKALQQPMAMTFWADNFDWFFKEKFLHFVNTVCFAPDCATG